VADHISDPFAPHDGWVARGAARLGCSEGQAYTMVIGLLLTTSVWVNALPNVVWRREAGAPSAAAVAVPSPSATTPVVVPTDQAPLSLPPLPLPQLTPVPGESLPGTQPDDSSFPLPEFTSPLTSASTVVVAGGWASSYAGTPLATLGVPDGDVLVSARATQPENIAYLKLQGESTPLVLAVDSAGPNVLGNLAALRLCVVTAPTWKVGRGDVPLDKAPATDCKRGIDGVPNSDGTSWSFDLAAVDLTGATGVALKPITSPSSPEFQVVLRLPTPSPTTASRPSPSPSSTTSAVPVIRSTP
jgi:hypothetical protein